MTAHLSANAIDRYRSKAITADEVRVMDSHLSECEQCRQRFTDSAPIDVAYDAVKYSLSQESESGAHIEYQELAAYVDGHLDAIARDLVEAHIKTCADCDRDVDEIAGVRDAISSDKRAATVAVPLWQKTGFRIGVEVAATLLLIAAVGWFSIRKIESLRAENEHLQKTVRDSEAAIADLKSQIDSPASSAKGATGGEAEITPDIKDGGGVVAIDAGGNLHGLESLPQEYRREVQNLLKTGRVTRPPVLNQLRGSSETILAGDSNEPGFHLSSPVGLVVETARPKFHWTKHNDATQYEVSVSSVKGELVLRAKVFDTSWQPSTPLARGRAYQWQVRTITANGHEIKLPAVGEPDAKFSILDRSTLNEIERARMAYSNSHLVLGTLYAKAGLVAEARHEFRLLLEINPESSITRRILDSLNRR